MVEVSDDQLVAYWTHLYIQKQYHLHIFWHIQSSTAIDFII